MNVTGPPRRHRPRTLGWLLVAAAGVVVFELTASPALTVALGCLKFGWDELATARWVKRHHPDLVRGRVLGQWLSAFGLWKTTVVAFVMTFALLMLDESSILPRRNRMPNGVSEEYVTAALLWIVGCFLSGAASIAATLAAYRHGVRVWVGRRRNWAAPILWTSGLFLMFVVSSALLAMVLMLTWAAIDFAHAPPVLEKLVQAGAPYFLAFGVFAVPALAFLLLKDRLDAKVLALSPAECWNVAWLDDRGASTTDPHLATVDLFDLEA